MLALVLGALALVLGPRLMRRGPRGELAQGTLLVTGVSPRPDVPGEQFVTLTDAVWRVRAYGDFFSYCLLAEGAVDIATEPEVKLWDLAALDVLVREAGGAFTSVDGRPGPHGGSAVATNGLIHDAVLAALAM